MKKFYSKPEAELISFYSQEEVTAEAGASVDGDLGSIEKPEGWT